jgi:hypothetical protein
MKDILTNLRSLKTRLNTFDFRYRKCFGITMENGKVKATVSSIRLGLIISLVNIDLSITSMTLSSATTGISRLVFI